jgi:hypothetical protein
MVPVVVMAVVVVAVDQVGQPAPPETLVLAQLQIPQVEHTALAAAGHIRLPVVQAQ